MKKILITGGSSGIGLACVKKFLSEGWHVISCSRDASTWEKKTEDFKELRQVEYHICDVSKQKNVELLFRNIKQNHSVIDAAINNASPEITSEGKFKDINIERLKDTIDNDFWSAILCMKHELNIMQAGASIVNITSINGIRPIPGAAVYGASKQGVESLTKSVALEAISENIRINSIAPGLTWTARWEAREAENPSIKQTTENLVPLKRFASPSEIADAAFWLSSEQASYIVGHTLVADGGLSLK